MKLFNLAALSDLFGGEYVLGKEDLGSDACYMIFGRLRPLENERLVRAGKGYDEIFCSVDGPVIIHSERWGDPFGTRARRLYQRQRKPACLQSGESHCDVCCRGRLGSNVCAALRSPLEAWLKTC